MLRRVATCGAEECREPTVSYFDRVTETFGDVPHMTEQPARELRDLITKSGARDILELGTLHGKSAAYMAATLEDLGREGHVTTIDLTTAPDRVPNAAEVLETLGLSHRVTGVLAHRSHTWEIGKWLHDGKRAIFDLCFFDGGHTYDPTTLGLFQVDLLMRPGGLIIVDDLHWTIDRSSLSEAFKAEFSEEERAAKPVGMAFRNVLRERGYKLSYANNRRWGVAQKPMG